MCGSGGHLQTVWKASLACRVTWEHCSQDFFQQKESIHCRPFDKALSCILFKAQLSLVKALYQALIISLLLGQKQTLVLKHSIACMRLQTSVSCCIPSALVQRLCMFSGTQVLPNQTATLCSADQPGSNCSTLLTKNPDHLPSKGELVYITW